MSQKSLAQWLGNLLSATALALPYVASLVTVMGVDIWMADAENWRDLKTQKKFKILFEGAT
jgi:hypothetical protein